MAVVRMWFLVRNSMLGSFFPSSSGQFCVPEGIVFSMPVRFQNGNWEVMTELEISETTQEVLGRLAHELIQVMISCI